MLVVSLGSVCASPDECAVRSRMCVFSIRATLCLPIELTLVAFAISSTVMPDYVVYHERQS